MKISIHDTLFVFWEDDRFPFVRGGEVKFLDDRGRFLTTEDFDGWIKPIAVFPLDAGLKINERLNVIKETYEKELLDFKSTSLDALCFSEFLLPIIRKQKEALTLTARLK